MKLYRIANKKYKDFTLSGIGAEKFGGRWNKVGTKAVYCSENISLALLEYYIHSLNPALLPKEVLVAEIDVPDSIKIAELDELPPKWNSYPYNDSTARIFTELVKKNYFLGLKVPSSIVEYEYNVILNPISVEFNKVQITRFFELEIDNRLRQDIISN